MKKSCTILLCILTWQMPLPAGDSEKRSLPGRERLSPYRIFEEFRLGRRTGVENPTLFLLAGSTGKGEKGEQLTAAPRPAARKRLGRAVLVTFGFVIADSIRYWIKYTKWLEDWQYKLNWHDQKTRFFTLQANRFDSNPFITNWSHIASGGGYYNAARYHRLNPLESLLFGLGFSLWWEYVTEWREVISINDNIFSGLGSIGFGEPLFQFGNYFAHRRGLLNRVVGTIFNPLITVYDLLGGKSRSWLEPPPDGAVPRFTLSIGPHRLRGDGYSPLDTFNIRLETSLNTIPGYGRAADSAKNLRLGAPPLYSEVTVDLSVTDSHVEEFQVMMNSVICGRFWQEIKKDSTGGMSGYSLYLGLGTGFDLFKKRAVADYDMGEYHFDFNTGQGPPQPTRYTDKHAVFNIAGPVIDLVLHKGPLRLRAAASAYLDFALVNAIALNSYSAYHDLLQPRLKTTLSYYGYYYAFGFTLATSLELRYGPFEIGGRLRYQRYGSVEGRDRFQSWVEDDSHVTDSRLLTRFDLGCTVPGTPLSLGATWEEIGRRGVLKEIRHRQAEQRFYLRLKIQWNGG